MTIDKLLNFVFVIKEKIIAGLTDFFDNHSNFIVKILKKIHPNYLTISRATFFPFAVMFFLVYGHKVTALIFWLVGWLTDPLDGPWATVTHQETKLGKILDPICDRTFFLIVIMTTIFINNFIWPLKTSLIIALMLELLLPALYLLAKLLNRPVILAHNKYGKCATILMAIALPLIWFNEHSESWQFILGGIISAAILTSLINIQRHVMIFLKQES